MLKYILLVYTCLLSTSIFAQQNTVIEGSIKNAANDSIALTIYKYINITDNIDLNQTLKKGKFKFSLDLKDPAYFSFASNNCDLNFMLIEPGDSIHVDIDAKNLKNLVFTGKGSEKLACQFAFDNKFNGWFKPSPKLTATVSNLYFGYLDSCRTEQIAFLDNFKPQLSPTAYQVLKTDVFYDCEWHKTRYLLNKIFGGKKDEANALYLQYLSTRKEATLNDTMAYSRNLIGYLQQANELDYNRLYNINGGKFDYNGKYSLAKALSYGKVQERLLAYLLLLQVMVNTDNASFSETEYLNGPYNDEFKQTVLGKYEFQKKFGPGKPAISFALPDKQDVNVQLENFKGKIVLVDFWFNGCTGCASLFKAMHNVKEHFKNNSDIAFINVSVDKTKALWVKGIELYNIADDVNLYTGGLGGNNPVIKAYGLNGYPAQFLIDRKGDYIMANPPRADGDNGVALIQLIESSLKKN